MKKQFIKLLFILIVLLPCLSALGDNKNQISLNEGWQFSERDKNLWYDATIPGSVQSDLIQFGVLPDPYWGTNEELIQWIENKDWDFKKTFNISKEQLSYDEIIIDFEGLDTHADVFLNGAKIISADNMFIAYEKEIKNLLIEGENNLYIRFYSPITHLYPAYATQGFDYPADNDHSHPRMSIYSRKAPYHFGWDWGMRMVQMGIWKPVYLKFVNSARISDLWINQLNVDENLAQLDKQIEIIYFPSKETQAVVKLSYACENDKPIIIEKEIALQKGVNTINLPSSISKPKLWMPVGWGEQNLYQFQVELIIDDKVIDQKFVKTGLRDIKLNYEIEDKESDEFGSFYFTVNGIPIFAKGANYIPGEIMTTKQDKAYYDRLFDNILEANMNMVRVWGGGIYEDDYFYQLADEKGVLIWQDFMFACTVYPHNDSFLQNIEKEAEYNIRRLRNNPSVALWCGNNEVAEALSYWGWGRKYKPEIMSKFQIGYDKIFKELLPDMVAQFDPSKDYIHTSPLLANWGIKDSWTVGDSHYWGVWYGREPFEILDQKVPRFMSEYGFQSFPEMKTIRSFATPDQWDIESETMTNHQKSAIGNDAIRGYMDMYYHTPSNFEDFIYVGLVMQGRGMSKGIKAHRRNRPYCMGTLYWQLNDSWPVVSWSGIDYYGNWKALHYHARDAYKPLSVTLFEENNSINVYTLSDLLSDHNKLKLELQLIDFNGNTVWRKSSQVNAKANSSEVVYSLSSNEILEKQRGNTVLRAQLKTAANQVIAEDLLYFDLPKNLNLPNTNIKYTTKQKNGKIIVTLQSKNLAKDVFIEISKMGAKFSDNFFDLLPNEKKVVEISELDLKDKEKIDIKIKHLRETY